MHNLNDYDCHFIKKKCAAPPSLMNRACQNFAYFSFCTRIFKPNHLNKNR